MKRASYRQGIDYIACNDEPEDMDPESVAGYISSSLLAFLFDVECERVGRDVVRLRKQMEKEAA